MRSTMMVLGAVLLIGGAARADFFDGKTLDGFEGLTEYWSVKDGAIVGTSPGINFNTFLRSKAKYKDFEMKFQVRLKGGKGNSGIQIRSSIVDKEKDKFVVMGPQCDMGAQYWGSLYGEKFGGMMKETPAGFVEKSVKKDDFNDYSIVCKGKHVTIKVNGETTVDGDFDKMPDDGIIAFQLHGGEAMEVTFKNIVFKDLSK